MLLHLVPSATNNDDLLAYHRCLSDRFVQIREAYLEAELARQLRLAMGISPEGDLDLRAVKRWIKRNKAVYEIGVPGAELVEDGDGLRAIVKEKPPRLVW